ncbi:hypothetical protein J3R83DRAFT_13944 [Lanmaoa asiatica]|nr:hypothetical protein J3R83DRAFT_13944 [Lanmaoa asiatica]
MGVPVVDIDLMYETALMHVTDHTSACQLCLYDRNDLPPKELLRLVKAIETVVGRIRSVYDDQLCELIGEPVIPRRLREGKFVLRRLG